MGTKLARIAERRNDLTEWLRSEAPGCSSEQRHLDEGTEARVYWHYGYMMALRDVLSFLEGRSTQLH